MALKHELLHTSRNLAIYIKLISLTLEMTHIIHRDGSIPWSHIKQRNGSIPGEFTKHYGGQVLVTCYMVLSSYLNPLRDFRFLFSRNYTVDSPKEKRFSLFINSLLIQLLFQDPSHSVPSFQMSVSWQSPSPLHQFSNQVEALIMKQPPIKVQDVYHYPIVHHHPSLKIFKFMVDFFFFNSHESMYYLHCF